MILVALSLHWQRRKTSWLSRISETDSSECVRVILITFARNLSLNIR